MTESVVTYRFLSKVMYPDGQHFTYEKTESLSWKVTENGYLLTLHGIGDELIDKKPPEEFDLIVSWLGRATYPVTIEMENGKIKNVYQIDDVRERWTKEYHRIIDLYENAGHIKDYIKRSSTNLATEETFIKAFSRDSITQLFYVGEYPQVLPVMLDNFPHVGEILPCKLLQRNYNNQEIYYNSESNENRGITLSNKAELYVKLTDKGYPELIQFLCKAEVARKGIYNKRIELRQTNDKY
ncbi:hypothetical protein [Hoylesella saccharolytica]|jgi:hypothetical protein|uniref:hypothetical protein n=1 Tax=Hoylesella saccharolytica TaxID=633701 RepID=UPI0028D4630F|nr:hypothetical protein [Hoylesella saccharolytica]